MFKSKILAHSLHPNGRDELITFELTYPRIIHGEFMTHRTHSRNSASSRAIPSKRMLKNIIENPFIPIHWGKNEPGMQAYAELTGWRLKLAKFGWWYARSSSIIASRLMSFAGLHKQLANRVTETSMWITVITTADISGWENFWHLRCHHAAEPHIQKIAKMSKASFRESQPVSLEYGEWHLPMILESELEELPCSDLVKISTGRCARVSYLTHDGNRDAEKDIELHDRLVGSDPKHASPTEHQAEAVHDRSMCGNLNGDWSQYRKTISGERYE